MLAMDLVVSDQFDREFHLVAMMPIISNKLEFVKRLDDNMYVEFYQHHLYYIVNVNALSQRILFVAVLTIVIRHCHMIPIIVVRLE